jgi:hypothetical protein
MEQRMTALAVSRFLLRMSAAAALLAGRGGSQLPIGVPGAMPQRPRILAVRRNLWATIVLFSVSLAIPDSVRAQKPDTFWETRNVRRLDIVASWGGLGPAEYEHTIIQRDGNAFAVDDQHVDAAKVTALLEALTAEPQREPSPSLIAGRAQEYNVDYFATEGLRRCAGDGADLSNVSATFKKLFYDERNQRRWITDEYSQQTFHTDDYPAENVTVTFDDGSTITASSQSQKALMLPFKVARDGASYSTFDDRIPLALSALTNGGVNSARLNGGEPLFLAYGYWLCDTFRDQITLAVLTAWAPQVARFIRLTGIATDGLTLSDDLGNLQGTIRFPEWPKGVAYRVDINGEPLTSTSITDASIKVLHEAKERGDSITSLPWVRRRLEGAPSPRLLLESNSLTRRALLADLRANSPAAYAAVPRSVDSVVLGTLWTGAQNEPFATFFFLPNGVAIDLSRGTLIDREGHTVGP